MLVEGAGRGLQSPPPGRRSFLLSQQARDPIMVKIIVSLQQFNANRRQNY